MSDPQQHGGLKLLSLDGGGIRGLSELLILREIMYRIKDQDKLTELPLPCEYFDMIGGTSTGGIIALMLGRLGMSVDEAIEQYGIISREVFSHPNLMQIGGGSKFSAARLEKAIKRVVREKTGKADELLINTQPEGQSEGRECKTFVCAMAAFNMRAGIPRLFRTYEAPAHKNPNCTIWEAARATSAAPTFFDRITITELGIGQSFVDGGLGRNNPTAQVLEEANLVFGSRQVACIVSIGTGQALPPGIPPPSVFHRVVPLDVVRALRGIATDCDATAEEISRRFMGTANVYFRFNVEQGLQNVGIAQWERLDEVMAHTGAYMSMAEVDPKLTAVVQALRDKPKTNALQFRPIYRTEFNVDPRNCDAKETRELYRDLLPRPPLIGYSSTVGNGSLTLKFEGLSPVRWRSFLNADLVGPVRAKATVDLANCSTIGTPCGAGVLVVLPDEEYGGICRDFYFLIEPSELPHLHVLKIAKPADLGNEWTTLHYEPLPHCSGDRKVRVDVTALDDMITVSTNAVASAWALKIPTSGGPQRLRAFGLCGIGPKQISWTSFQLSVVDKQPKPSGPELEFDVDPVENPTLDTMTLLLMDETRRKAEAKAQAEARAQAKNNIRVIPAVDLSSPAVIHPSKESSTLAVIPKTPKPAPIPFWLAYHTGFDFDPRLCTPGQLKELYRDLVPCEPLNGYRMIAGKGSLTIDLEGVKPVRWRSFLNAELLGPVRVEAVVDLANLCVAVGTPSGAGVLVVLPDKEHGDVCHDFCFLVEPSEPPYLRVVKSAKLGELSNEWTSLHSESLPHCSGQHEVRVEVNVLHDVVTVSTNSVASTWALKAPTSGGPQGLRAFGLCGIGPERLSWKSFQIYIAQEQPILNNTSSIFEGDHPADGMDRDTVQKLRLEEAPTVTPSSHKVLVSQESLIPSGSHKPQLVPSVDETKPPPNGSSSEFEGDPDDDWQLALAKALSLQSQPAPTVNPSTPNPVPTGSKRSLSVISTPSTLVPLPWMLVYRTGFDVDPGLCTPEQLQQLYRDLLPREPLTGYRALIGGGSLTLEFEGLNPVRWRSFLNADLNGPVRVEAAVELAKCTTFGTPSGAGVLVVLPDEEDGNVCRDFFFLVEPSKPPYLRVLKMAKPADLTNEWSSLYSEPLPHCSGQQEVLVEVTVLDDIITVSTNSVPSAWALKVPATGGPKRLRAFGLCGIGPRRFSWSSFQVSVAEAQISRNYSSSGIEEDLDNDPDVAMAIMLSLQDKKARLGA